MNSGCDETWGPVGGSVARDYDRGYEHRGYEREMQTVPHSKVAEDVRWPGSRWLNMLSTLEFSTFSTCAEQISRNIRHVQTCQTFFPRFGTLAETVRVSFSIASISWIQLDPVGVCQVPAQYLDQDYCITSEDPDGNWMELGFQCKSLAIAWSYMGPILFYVYIIYIYIVWIYMIWFYILSIYTYMISITYIYIHT